MGEGKSANSLWNATPTPQHTYIAVSCGMENQLFLLPFEHYQSCVALQTFLWPICLSAGIQSVFNGLIVFLQLLFLRKEYAEWAEKELR